MKKFLFILLLCPLMAFSKQDSTNQEDEFAKLNWIKGPVVGEIGDKAKINVPKGYVFLNEKDTSRYIELSGNPPMRNHYLIAPQSFNWWAVFTFSPVGYVKDDEKIDAEDLLSKLKSGDSIGNEERKKLGLDFIFTDGWQLSPHYDNETKRLEWAVRLRTSNGVMNVNYTTRLLGRTGYMSGILVGDTETLSRDSAEFKTVLKQFDFVSGERYSEFKAGDHVAELGLAALVLGGAAAVATKKGFWAVLVGFAAAFWKLALVGIAAVGAAISGIFKKKQ